MNEVDTQRWVEVIVDIIPLASSLPEILNPVFISILKNPDGPIASSTGTGLPHLHCIGVEPAESSCPI